MKKVPGCFLDRCKSWTRDLYGHNLDILLGLQSLNQPIRSRAESWNLSELTDALCHWIERKRSRVCHWIYFRYLKTIIYTDDHKRMIMINWGASFRWSFGPLSAWSSIESTIILNHASQIIGGKRFFNILKLSATHFVANIHHQHRCNRFSGI